MKRITAIFLTLLLTLQLSACIEVVDGGYRPNGSTTERAEDSFDRIPRPPTPVVYPMWSGLAETSEAFLSMTGAIVDVSKRTYSYAEMVEDLSHLARLHSDYFSYHSFGTSVAGRELYVAVLGNPEASRQILVSAGIHGRE